MMRMKWLAFSAVVVLTTSVCAAQAPRAAVAANSVAASAASRAASSGPKSEAWRYKFHNGHWWYWLPKKQWAFWTGSGWQAYTPQAYRRWYRETSLARAWDASFLRYAAPYPGYVGNAAGWYSKGQVPQSRPFGRYEVGDFGYGGYGYGGYSNARTDFRNEPSRYARGYRSYRVGGQPATMYLDRSGGYGSIGMGYYRSGGGRSVYDGPVGRNLPGAIGNYGGANFGGPLSGRGP